MQDIMQNKINELLAKFEQKRGKIDLSLNRITRFLEDLGSPHRNLPPIIHVAGTNGKGSTISFLRAMIESEGKTCHVYTSPHLVSFNERIVIHSKTITNDFLYEILKKVDDAAANHDVTFFEITTAAAFLAFSQVQADYLLLEVGLGGRLDATNVIDNPILSVITPISFDHTEYLGNTIEKIATEKAAIIKPNCKVVSAPQAPEAESVIRAKAKEVGAKLVFSSPLAVGTELSLKGIHQLTNAGTAVEAARIISISDSAIQKGLQKASWPARIQKLTKGDLVKLLPENWELWLDGAHNEAGAKAIADYFDNFYMIMGMLSNKDAKTFLSHLSGKIKILYTIPIPNERNSAAPQDLAKIASELGISAIPMENAEKAIIDIILRSYKPAKVLITGSLYLAGKILENNS